MEIFLEQTFTRFMCGAKNSAGFPEVRYVNPANLQHALNILKQNQRYVDWTVGSDVIQRAKLYFKNGEPFSTTLGGSLNYLTEMKTIRNRIAHESKKVEENFRELVRQKVGHLKRGMVPGKLLMSRVPITNTRNVLEEYENVLLTSATILVT
jgi:hypothetical protein